MLQHLRKRRTKEPTSDVAYSLQECPVAFSRMEPVQRELTEEQRLFLPLGPEKGWSNARTIQEFTVALPDRHPPGRSHLMIKKAIQNMKKRARQCRLNLGGAFEGRKPH